MAPVILAALATALLVACSGDDAKPTDVPQENGTGRLFQADGKPAAFATVRIFKVGEVPEPIGRPKLAKKADAVLVTRTDAQGLYKVGDIDNGEYNILASLDSGYSYQDSLALGGTTGIIPPDTLEDPAVVRGYVGIEPQHNPRTVTVQLLGTNRFVNVDEKGRFEFRDLAAGAYTVRLVTTESEYTPTYSTLKAQAGRETVLQDTMRIIYTDIPAVSGLKVVYDTLSGVAHLRWNKVPHALLQDYIIYRDMGQDAPATSTILTSVRDTVFADTLWESTSGNLFSPTNRFLEYDDSSEHAFTWRVRPRLMTQAVGPFLKYFSLPTISPKWIHTQTTWRLSGPYADVLTVKDTVPLVVSYLNPLHKITAIRWYDDEKDPPLREITPNLTMGSDTLIFRSGTKSAQPILRIHLVDVSGNTTRITVALRVYDDEPGVKMTSSVQNPAIGESIRLQGSGTDLGRIIKWEWSIGKGAPFIRTSRPDSTFAVSHVPLKGAPFAYLRATDEDGRVGMDSIQLNIIPWTNLKSMPRFRKYFTATGLNGRIYAIGGSGKTVDAYDPETDTWQSRAPMKRERHGHQVAVFGDEIMVVGGLGEAGEPVFTTEFYNTTTDSWRYGPDLNLGRAFFGMVKIGARLYAFEGELPNIWNRNNTVEYYDSAGNSWSGLALPASSSATGSQSRFSFGTSGSKVFVIGGFPISNRCKVWDFSDSTNVVGDPLEMKSLFRTAITYHDRILLAGGDFWGPGVTMDDRFDEFDVKTGEFRKLSNIKPARARSTLAILDGKLYMLGGFLDVQSNELTVINQVLAVPLDSIQSTF